MTTVFAQATEAAAGAPSLAASIVSFAPFILVFVFMYLVMIRPQRKKEKELKKQISEMKVGDKVTTIGGVYGKVHKIKDDYVIIETGMLGTQNEKSYIRFKKGAIDSVEQKISN